jgi:hypothetical protein
MEVKRHKKEKNEKENLRRRFLDFFTVFLRSLTNDRAGRDALFSSEADFAWHNIRRVAPRRLQLGRYTARAEEQRSARVFPWNLRKVVTMD